MRNLILLFIKYNSLILFLVLEILCFFLIINFNQRQQEIFINSSNIFSSNLLNQKHKLNNYLQLQELNDSLVNANASLLKRLIDLEGYGVPTAMDTNHSMELIPAKIISQSIHLRNNMLTLNKGSVDGVRSGTGVITHDGLVGIITNVSKRFSQEFRY